jgi:hypothetical protein
LARALNFSTTGSAFLTTEKLAIMAGASYGNLTLEFRWQWVEGASLTTLQAGTWTLPSATASSPYLPSIFYPAPRVALVSTSPSPATIGTNFISNLSGYVTNTSFRMVLEFPSNGTEIRSQWDSSGSASRFSAPLLLLSSKNWLVPGKYLVHIHDACEAILFSFPVQVVYPSSATVSFQITPTFCTLLASISYNGTSYSSGSSTTVTPSSVGASVSASGCFPYSFQGWTATGGLHLGSNSTSSTVLVVSAGGTLTARYG